MMQNRAFSLHLYSPKEANVCCSMPARHSLVVPSTNSLIIRSRSVNISASPFLRSQTHTSHRDLVMLTMAALMLQKTGHRMSVMSLTVIHSWSWVVPMTIIGFIITT